MGGFHQHSSRCKLDAYRAAALIRALERKFGRRSGCHWKGILLMYKILKHQPRAHIFVVLALFLFAGCSHQSSGGSGSSPTIFPTDQVVIEYSDWLADGGSVSWKLEPGAYRLDLTANNDGATAEWVGAGCPKTQPMRELTMTCEMPRTGQLVVTNPTRLGLGAKVSITVKVTKLAR